MSEETVPDQNLCSSLEIQAKQNKDALHFQRICEKIRIQAAWI